jgi:hypothetical protein
MQRNTPDFNEDKVVKALENKLGSLVTLNLCNMASSLGNKMAFALKVRAAF